MKTIDEFKSFYESDLADAIAKSQREIEQYSASEETADIDNSGDIKTLIIVGIIVTVILLPFLGILALAAGAMVGYTIWKHGSKLRNALLESTHEQETIKSNVASKIISFFGEDFSLDPTGQIDKETINKSLTLPRAAKVAYGEDYVRGTVGDTDIEFSEAILSRSPFAEVKQFGSPQKGKKKELMERMNQRMRKGAAGDNKHFFRGLYFIADFHKHFRGHTVVRPTDADLNPNDRLETADGSTLGSLEQVQLEDPELESVCNIYGTDQQQARYILSTSLMERIKGFRERTGKSIYLSFYKSNMHMAVPYSRDLLELRETDSVDDLIKNVRENTSERKDSGKTVDQVIDRDRVFDYFKDITFILGIVEEFDLNKRIWLKE